MTGAAVREVVERYNGLSGLLGAAAAPEERWSLYSSLGLALTCHRHGDTEYVTGTLGIDIL